ncbi:MAG: hypothetical protein RSA66_09520 [Muribaculaceae bacterium]
MEKEVKAYFDRCPTATEVWTANGKLWRTSGAAESTGKEVKRWTLNDVAKKESDKK